MNIHSWDGIKYDIWSHVESSSQNVAEFLSHSVRPLDATKILIPLAGWWFQIYYIIWVNYNDLTTTSLEILVNKGNHHQMALIQVSEIL